MLYSKKTSGAGHLPSLERTLPTSLATTMANPRTWQPKQQRRRKASVSVDSDRRRNSLMMGITYIFSPLLDYERAGQRAKLRAAILQLMRGVDCGVLKGGVCRV